jgi:rhodanese-related sulfurtransferase
MNPIEQIDVHALAEREGLVIDVREPSETMYGIVAGARLIPLGTLEDALDTIPDDADVYLICRSGARSALATEILLAAGKRAANVAGGMIAWQSAGLPIVLP